MSIITDFVLNKILLDLINYSQSVYVYHQYYKFLYDTGLRPIEPLRSTSLVLRGPEDTVIQPVKNNNTRTIKTNLIPSTIWREDHNNTSVIQEYQKESAANYMRNYPPTSELTTENKQVLLYLFRYNYVKKMYATGSTLKEIKKHMGWKHIEMAQNYVGRAIYNKNSLYE